MFIVLAQSNALRIMDIIFLVYIEIYMYKSSPIGTVSRAATRIKIFDSTCLQIKYIIKIWVSQLYCHTYEFLQFPLPAILV